MTPRFIIFFALYFSIFLITDHQKITSYIKQSLLRFLFKLTKICKLYVHNFFYFYRMRSLIQTDGKQVPFLFEN